MHTRTDAFTRIDARAYTDHVTKPLLDIVVVCYLLVRRTIRAQRSGGGRQRGAIAIAASPLVLAATVIGVSMRVLKKLSPPFGAQAAARSQAAGELRAMHARVAANAEEIALLRGESMEETHLSEAFRKVAKHDQVTTLSFQSLLRQACAGIDAPKPKILARC